MNIIARVVTTVLLTGLIISGCSVEPSKVTDSNAEDMGSKITYFRDSRTGICFATVASRKTMDTDQSGLGLTQVDCGACASLLVN